MLRLPSEYAALANDDMIPADRYMVVHRPSKFSGPRPRKSACGSDVWPVSVGTAVSYGTAVCPACFGAETGRGYGPKEG